MEMSTVIMYIKDLFSTFMILLMMISPAFSGSGVAYQAQNPDELRTSFAVVSDIHVETNQPKSYNNLKSVLEGIKAGEDISTVVYTGDNVMNGQVLEDLFFYSAIRAMKPAENNFVVAGNHDLGNGDGDVAQLSKKFMSNNHVFLGNKLENPYYYRVVDGCYMIVLVSDDTTSEDFKMNEAQFQWLEGVLKEAEAANAPVFVFNHFPLRYLDGDSPIQREQLAELLIKYDTELFIHGHIHNDMGTDNFYTSYGVDCINLPRVTEITEYEAGDGIVVELYDDEILVRTRNFITGEWVEELTYTYDADR